MPGSTLYVVVPGDLETRTGGYGYDRRIVAGLRERGWRVELVILPGTYPFPSSDERAIAARAFGLIPDQSVVLADGLALGVLPGEVAPEKARLRLVALVHHPLALETGLDASVAASLRESEREALASVRGIVVTSAQTVPTVADLAPGARIVVVEPGTDASPVAKGSTGGPIHLLCVASVVPRKGHDTLVAALARLKTLDWRLVCVGSLDRDAAFAAAVVQACEAGGIVERVQFSGELADERLEAVYDTADLFVLPTHFEGYGMAVAEAVARAIPVVSTATGAIADLVANDSGVLVGAGNVEELAEALRPLMEDRGLLNRLRAGAGRRRTTLRTWQTACAELEAALLRLSAA